MKTNKNRRFKGSVLFTVVSVMALLIIFLMGTLVLASSANNRAHKSYSTSQTQYTARAAVDSILAAIGDTSAEGKALATAVAKLDNVTDTPINVTVDVGNSSLGRVTNAEIALIDKAFPVYDSNTQQWVYCKRYAISAEVTMGKDTTTVTSYVLADMPETPVTVSSGGGFMTTGSVGAPNHTCALGGTYIALDPTANKYYIEADPFNPDEPMYTLEDKKYLSDSGLGKDKDGKPVAPYLIDNGSIIEAPIIVDGSLRCQTSGMNVLFSTTGEGMAVWGNLTFENSWKFISANMTNDDSDLSTPDVEDPYNWNEIPYIYADGKISTTSQLQLGTGDFPLNVFCGNIVVEDKTFSIYADVYCFDADKTSKFAGSGVKLYNWTSSLVNQTSGSEEFGGNFYSKGNLESAQMLYEGDVKVEGDMTVVKENTGGTTTINGDLVVGGILHIDDEADLQVTGEIYANNVTGKDVTMSSTGVEKDTITTEEKEAVLVKNVKYYNNGTNLTDKQQKNWAWVREAFITENSLEPNEDGEYDLAYSESLIPNLADGKNLYDHYLLEKLDNKPAEGTTYPYTAYIDTEFGREVAPEDIYDKGLAYKDKFIKPLDEYTSTEDIFPGYAEKAVILGLEKYQDKDIAETKVLPTVEEKVKELLTQRHYPTTMPDIDVSKTYDAIANKFVDDTGKEVNEITESCTIKNVKDVKDGKLYIKPQGNTLWIKLDSSTITATEIIVDDTAGGRVNFFVSGSVTLNGSKIITSKYKHLFDNQNKEIWALYEVNDYIEPGSNPKKVKTNLANPNKPAHKALFEDASTPVIAPSPNIYIYSGSDISAEDVPSNSFKVENGSLHTAYIQAPYMHYNAPTGGNFSNKFYYDNECITDNGNVKVTSVGCVICYTAEMANNWTNVYILEGDGGSDDEGDVTVNTAFGSNTYRAVDYSSY